MRLAFLEFSSLAGTQRLGPRLGNPPDLEAAELAQSFLREVNLPVFQTDLRRGRSQGTRTRCVMNNSRRERNGSPAITSCRATIAAVDDDVG